jgi:thiosulfate dehydrogenase
MRFLVGVFFGVLILPLSALVWVFLGKVPVAVADPPFPYERRIVSYPLNARIDKESIADAPIPKDEHAYVAGARIYSERCGVCHGYHGRASALGAHMYPDAPQLFEAHGANVVGVSDDPVGETHWKVLNGIRLTGMPAFKSQLSDTEIWQVSLLLANADKPLPPAALEILHNSPAPPAEGPPPPPTPGPFGPPKAPSSNE